MHIYIIYTIYIRWANQLHRSAQHTQLLNSHGVLHLSAHIQLMYLTGNGFGSTPMKQSELSQLLNLIFSHTLNVHFTPLLSALRSARKCITANPPSIIIGKHLLQHCRTVPIKRLHVLLMCECVVLRNKYTHILKSLHICTYAAKVSLKSERYT